MTESGIETQTDPQAGLNEQGNATEAPNETLPARDPIRIKAYFAELGRRGGLKGGPARSASLTPERRREIAKKAIAARWAKARAATA
jgi:hypothetical protein